MAAPDWRRLARRLLAEAGALPPDKLVKRLAKAAARGAPSRPHRAAAAAWVVAALDDDRLEATEAGVTYRGTKTKKKRRRGEEEEEASEEGGGRAPAPPSVAAPPPAPPPPATPAADRAPRAGRGDRAAGAAGPAPPRPAVPPGASAAAAAAAAGAAAAVGALPRWRESTARADVKKGRFTQEERDAVVAAVRAFAHAKGLPPDDTGWLFETRTGPDKERARGAWKAVAAALPHRTTKSVYSAGTRLLHPGNYGGAWPAADVARLRALVAARGHAWAAIGPALGRLPAACRDKWRELGGDAPPGAPPLAGGRWRAEEAAALDGAVRAHLATRAGGAAARRAAAGAAAALPLPPAGAVASPHGHLDCVDWDAVAAAVGGRSARQCREKWYSQLSPSMLARGDWGRGDDRRLLAALLALAPGTPEHAVAWEGVVAGRSGAAAKRRWALMKRGAPRAGAPGAPASDAPGDVARALAAVHAPQMLEGGGGGG